MEKTFLEFLLFYSEHVKANTTESHKNSPWRQIHKLMLKIIIIIMSYKYC